MQTKWLPKSFKKVAVKHNLTLPAYTIDLFDGDLNLSTTLPVFTRNYQFPANYQVAGPIFANLKKEIPTEIQKVITEAKAAGKQVVYLALGSSGNKKLAIKLLNYFAKTDFIVIAPLAVYFKDDLRAWPENIYLVDWLPALAVSQQVDFSVIHGGEGTVQTACAAGKPFIGIGLQYEQEINVRFCETFGNAVSLAPNKVNDTSLTEAIEKISEATVKEKATELEVEMASLNGAKKAAKIIVATYLK
ncbi:UDP:flavonoid glycosyltransferase YjiC (YdhE family) [Enterococcus sp. PF1-24]|uniref:glycosyltransferase n=1 Tax=unclassified Enterococcus TaxID=2608891 RepID=UPI00247658A7|nr:MULTISPECIES: nucleotide disphospho-sugar-binding domain-containing protein [unclassified Enterococcus]MDH6365246.1 UDP:flavonoid glycosyltransferase YjiC (YdhE family) [Enterococcus sp. PFB1-1]MDH6402347.1 UDP:flavonoid glycosyltransferase YjiC (YdhE family) [Enterococcus sp. PF1-24]